MSKLKFSQHFKYNPLSKYEGMEGTIPCRANATYVGIELEMEEVKLKHNIPSSFKEEMDGSLKLNGKEFITVPIKFKYLEKELERLFECFQSAPLLSSRCSIHVHLNARDMNMYELSNLLILYSIYEKALFNFSGNREDNIFCVPLYYYPNTLSNVLYSCDSFPDPTRLDWYKYYALNISPIFGGEGKHKLGTIEFRHMAPTMDIHKIITWVNLLVSLKLAAKKLDKNTLKNLVQTMNTDSSYHQLTSDVFQDWANIILQQPTFKKDIESCITRIKETLIHAGCIQPKLGETEIHIPQTMKGTKLCVV